MDPEKKISFGFNKLVKKTTLIQTKPVEEKKVELVECLEGQSIKIKDAVEIVNEPLVIPIKENKKNIIDRIKEARAKNSGNKEDNEDTRPDSELTIEELAARELINEAKKRLSQQVTNSSKVFTLPVKEEPALEGEKEPTLKDYESVPISDYGLAMLRGMGWKDGMGIGKNGSKVVALTAPELRPKGLGLGATKLVNTEKPNKSACDKDGNELVLKKGAHAKIIAGLHKGNFCEVQGLDDEAGRVIVKTSLKKEVLTLNEFLVIPVTKEEFYMGSKILNNAKYEEFKEKSDKKLEQLKKNYSDDEQDRKSDRRSRKDSSDYKEKCSSKHRSSSSNNKSNAEKILKKKSSKKSKSRNRRLSRSSSEDCDRSRKNNSDSDDNEKEKKKDKKKKKHRDRGRSRSFSDSDYKKRGSKKSKSKSRHRRKSKSDSDSEHEKKIRHHRR